MPGEQVYMDDLSYGYWVYLPSDYTPERSWPLVLFLHGRGSGRNKDAMLEHGPPFNVARGEDFPFILVSPRSLPGEWWSAEELQKFLDIVLSRYPVDTRRIYLTGLSMGGFGSWALGARAPEYFAAIAPICGGGNPDWASQYGDMPIRAYHGAYDKVVKPEKSVEMVDAIKAVGGNAELIMLPKAAHVSWPEVYNNPEFWAWLLSHEREKGVTVDANAELRYRLKEEVQWRLFGQTAAGSNFRELRSSLEVRNRLEIACQVEAILQPSRGISVEPESVSMDLLPGQQRQLHVSFVASEPVNWESEPGCKVILRTSIMLPDCEALEHEETRTYSFSRHQVIPTREISVTVDGYIEEQVEMSHTFIEDYVLGTAVWTDDGLYLAFSVEDSTPFMDAKLPVWEQDSLEIRFDLRAGDEQSLPTKDWDDVLPVLIAPGQGAGDEVVWKRSSIPEEVCFAARKTETGYIVEIEIPKKLMEAVLSQSDGAFRMNVAQNDFEVAGRGVKRWFEEDWRSERADSSKGIFVFEQASPTY